MASDDRGHMWVLGDKKRGYSVKYLPRYQKTEPWWSYVWSKGSVVRRDGHRTKEQAVRYCHSRAGAPTSPGALAPGIPRGMKRHTIYR